MGNDVGRELYHIENTAQGPVPILTFFLRVPMPHDNVFPDPPAFTEEDFDACRRSGDFCPILFEWYKYTAVVANLITCIQLDSPAVKPVQNTHFGILIGLLNRCCRLMLANVALSHEGLYGETTALVDRCIFESTVKVLWLCTQNSNNAFEQYLGDGLKPELALKTEIDARISQREGISLVIEERMLASIAEYIHISGMTAAQIDATKKLPDLASMLASLGRDRLSYVVGQKIGSHHVHGTWPSLLLHYLEWDKHCNFRPRDHDARTHVNQYVFIPLMLLDATKAFCLWLMKDPEASTLVSLLDAIESELTKINREVVGDDFNVAEVTPTLK